MHYLVSGLHLLTDHPIAGLKPCEASPRIDVRISVGETLPRTSTRVRWYANSDLDASGKPTLAIWTAKDGAYFRMAYRKGGEFLFDRSGTSVWGVWSESISFDDRSVCLLGPVLSFILCLRGITCLHASAVAIGDRAIAFVGPEGAGKSTVAAAFALRRCGVIADDVVALDISNGATVIHPSYPWLRLRPSAANALFDVTADAADLPPKVNGLYFDLGQDRYKFEERPLALAAVYLLTAPSNKVMAPKIEAVTGGEALISLVGNTWAAAVLDPSMRAREFEILSELCASVPVRGVRRSQTRNSLEVLLGAILKDLQHLNLDSDEIRTLTYGKSPNVSLTA